MNVINRKVLYVLCGIYMYLTFLMILMPDNQVVALLSLLFFVLSCIFYIYLFCKKKLEVTCPKLQTIEVIIFLVCITLSVIPNPVVKWLNSLPVPLSPFSLYFLGLRNFMYAPEEPKEPEDKKD